MQLTIGITETEAHYANYPIWIKGNNADIEIIKLTSSNFDDIKKCDGIVLTGGIDTHPRFYHNQRLDYPLAPDKFNEARDEFELKIFEYATKNSIPVLAVCRGMQLVNVALGGDLIQDIEESGKQDHRKHGGIDGQHEISVTKNSLLYQIIGNEKGLINSAHHQALGKISTDLMVSAISPDGIAEGLEWKDKENKSFLLCVQWHPERLAQNQPNNPFTAEIRKQFLNAIKKTKSKI